MTKEVKYKKALLKIREILNDQIYVNIIEYSIEKIVSKALKN